MKLLLGEIDSRTRYAVSATELVIGDYLSTAH